jgi:putative ABC transport system ATP-binding protein
MNVIELQNVRKVFKTGDHETVALDNISLSVAAGEFVAIMGPSGSGKSTLMNILGLLDIPTSGSYLIDGDNMHRSKDNDLARLRREKIGFVFQSFNLLPRMNVVQNVELPMIYTGRSRSDRRGRAMELLKMVGLEKRAKFKPNVISGGETQRVAVARALANKPSLILADEPTGNLDTKNSDLVMKTFKQLHNEGVSIVLITHNPEIAEYADRTIVIRDGKIVETPVAKASAPAKSAPKKRVVRL